MEIKKLVRQSKQIISLVLILLLFPTFSVSANQNTETTKPLHESPVLGSTKYYKRFTANVKTDKGLRSLNYYWFAPKPPYPEGVRFPMVVMLHGSTGFSYAGQYLIQSALRTKYPAFILVPMTAKETNTATWSYHEPILNTQELPNVVKLLKTLKGQYPIDEDRIYIIGCSMGGHGVFGASVFYDDVFAAGVSISGAWPTQDAPKMTKMPLLVMAGAMDTVVKTSKTRNLVSVLKAKGAPVIYKEFPIGHNCPSIKYYTEPVWKWMFSKTLKP